MKTINNNPKYEPAIGKFAQIGHQLSFLEVDCLYLMPSVSDEISQEIKTAFQNQMKVAEITGDFMGNYSSMPLQEIPYLEDKDLRESFTKEEYNAIMPLSFSNENETQCLLVKLTEKNIPQQVSMIFYTVERYSKLQAEEILHQKLLDKPEEFKKWLEPLLSVKTFIKNFITSKVHSLFNPTLNLIAQPKALKEILGITGDILDFHQKHEILNRIVENVNKVRKTGDKKADAELTYLINSIPTEYIIEMLKNLTPSQLKKATSYLDPNVYAEKSRLRFEIRNPKEVKGYTLPTNKKIKNIGTYQLFIYKGDYFKAVNFNYKASFIVYLIYMIDKYKKREDIDPIDMLEKKWEDEYLRLFNIVYPNHTDEAKSTYLTLCSEFKENSKERKKKRLSDCYADIKVCVGSSCEELGEIFNPHIIENAGDHLSTKAYNIYIPYQLL